MIDPTLFPAVAAVVAAVGVSVVLFVPFVMLQYRRRGTLGWPRIALDFAMLVYAFAIVGYTLLPLPVVTEDFCVGGGAGSQLQPGRFIADILDNGVAGPGELLRNPALLQVLLNIGLFVPLGIFVRYAFRRGILVTVVVGLAVSVLVEATQLTGVWSIFPCSYRLFDVDDLVANTIGAFLGAVIAPVLRLLPSQDAEDPAAPRPVRAGRRLLGMVCDVAAVVLIGGTFTAIYGIALLIGDLTPPTVLDSAIRAVTTTALPAATQLALLLATGRTIGEAAVRLRPRLQTGRGETVVRWLVGIGGYTLLTGTAGLALLAPLLVVATIVVVFRSRNHRGLAYLAAGWDVTDDRAEPASAVRSSQATSRGAG